MELITTLIQIKNNLSIIADARFKTIGLIEGLCKYEIVLTAQIYLRIFLKTTPLFKYLQGHGVNIITSYQMVQATLEEFKLNARDFSSVKEAADNFVAWANNKLEDEDILQLVISTVWSTLSQDLLESFMLIEKELVNRIDLDKIIDQVASKSKLLQKLLLF
ncbi:Hypothetical protein CINCED_3A003119 [Cinara cedri]|uniref:Uncharacterized protein n=1 Tax=Cinara cedri TaxID=506608 RepID=A0A5E4NE68_9HEMI|nr:Hypothetical protein CINCED_3A003119 [Cinara cedri]